MAIGIVLCTLGLHRFALSVKNQVINKVGETLMGDGGTPDALFVVNTLLCDATAGHCAYDNDTSNTGHRRDMLDPIFKVRIF